MPLAALGSRVGHIRKDNRSGRGPVRGQLLHGLGRQKFSCQRGENHSVFISAQDDPRPAFR